MPPDSRKISRRQFARDAALATATAALLPSDLAQQEKPRPAVPSSPQAAEVWAQLPAASQAEVEAKHREVLRRFGARFTTEQKSEVRRQLILTQKALDTMRAFPLENSDQPATVLRLSRSKARPRPTTTPAPRKGKD